MTTAQAGLLTSGSSFSRAFPFAAFPVEKTGKQWQSAGFVPGYSGGPVFDLHEVPY
jgi:hypothetical protein